MIAVSIAWADVLRPFTGAAVVLALVASIVALVRFVGGLKLDEMAEAIVERITR